MWFLNQEGEEFQALSYGDKFRLSRYLVRGEAPRDPRMAAAAVEVGEIYQSKSRSYIAAIRWTPVFLVVVNAFFLASAAIDGDELRLILSALIALGSTADLMLSPLTRPKNMARAVEAARWVEGMQIPEVDSSPPPSLSRRRRKGAELQADHVGWTRR
jgi:hypothetical protein